VTINALSVPPLDPKRVSPELVLVDPGLAALARERLRDPGDTLVELVPIRGTRLEPLLPPRIVPAPSWDQGSQALRRLTETSLGASPEAASYPRDRPRLGVVAIAVAMPAVALVAALGLSLWFQAPGSRGTSEPTATPSSTVEAGVPPGGGTSATEPAQSKTELPSSAGQSGETPSAEPRARRLAWAPAPEASEYRVELFRGSSLVFSADTTSTALVLPASWRIEGRIQRLVAGEYRWYVWPLVAGRRGTQAIVQARLDIGASSTD